MEHSKEELRSAGELLRLVVKTRKVLRLYESENEISRRLEETLATTTADHLDQWGPCELNVLKSELGLGDTTVYRSDEQADNIAFLLFRDGIRQLTLLPGIDRQELHDLLTAINRVSRASNTDEDLVTIFWERDFTHIRYFAIEELSEAGGGVSIEDQLASPQLESGQASGDAGLEDLSQTLSHLPIEACMLTAQETEQLDRQLAEQEEVGMARVLVDLAIDLTLLSEEGEARDKIATGLVTIFDRMIVEEAVDEAIEAVVILDELTETRLAGSAPVAALRDRVLQDLAEPKRLAAVLHNAEASGAQLGALRYLLMRLGESALPPVVAGLAELKSDDFQAVAAEVIHAAGPVGIRHLLDYLDVGSTKDPDFFRAVLQVLRRIPGDETVDVVERLLEVPDSPLHRQALRDLGPYREGNVGKLWLRLLEDEDEQLRMQAVSAIVRGGLPATVEHLMHRATDSGFATRSDEEKRQLMTGIGRLARDEALGWFKQLLGAARGGLFASRRDRELIRAAVAGLRAVGSQGASRLLGELARSGSRRVRAACRESLEMSERQE
ncbi:MAG: HEAT repeat domain-containing protein [Thermoanaerobaculales bacterium]